MGFFSTLFGGGKRKGLDINLKLDRITPKKQEALDKAVSFLNELTSIYHFEVAEPHRSDQHNPDTGTSEIELIKEGRDPYHKFRIQLELSIDEDANDKRFLSGIEMYIDLMYDYDGETVTAFVQGTADKVIQEFSKHEAFLSTVKNS